MSYRDDIPSSIRDEIDVKLDTTKLRVYGRGGSGRTYVAVEEKFEKFEYDVQEMHSNSYSNYFLLVHRENSKTMIYGGFDTRGDAVDYIDTVKAENVFAIEKVIVLKTDEIMTITFPRK